MRLAPIVIFTYNRPLHLSKTLNYLKKNNLSKKSKIIFFSDGLKNNKDNQEKKKVNEVKNIIRNVKGFKSKEIFYKRKNVGLKKNIISGVSKILKKYKKIIVIEDDVLVGKYFLEYMNMALERYKDHKKVWHISGWNYDLNLKKLMKKHDAFFIRNMNCWGWATWENRWKRVIFNPNFFLRKMDQKKINEFNLDNVLNNWSQILRNKNKKLNTWGIFWNATIFFNGGLCLNPKKTLTCNIGLDGSGTNSLLEKKNNRNISSLKRFRFPKNINEIQEIRNQIINQLKKKNISSKRGIFSIF